MEKSGIVALVNLKTDRAYVFYADDVQSECARQRFSLDLGMHPCSSLQQDYEQTGLEVFRFDVVQYTTDPSALESIRSKFSSLYE